MNAPTYARVPAAALRAGYIVSYPVQVDGKEIITSGEVFQVRRVAENRAAITLLHAKTGALFTNIVKGSDPVRLYSAIFASDAVALAMQDTILAKLKGDAANFYTAEITR